MNPLREHELMLTRRQLFGRAATGIGTAALGSLLGTVSTSRAQAATGLPGFPNFPARAKRVIYLHQSGAPSQMDLFDFKPTLQKRFAEELPDSIRQGQRLTGMTSTLECAPTMRHGKLCNEQLNGEQIGAEERRESDYRWGGAGNSDRAVAGR